jgi:gluconate 2-dehydrogenase alpha chain
MHRHPFVSSLELIQTNASPPDTPRWGRDDWNKATAKWYGHAFSIGASGCNCAHREHHLDLDPTCTDALGRPLIRMTYDFHENDDKRAAYLGPVLESIAEVMNPTLMSTPSVRRGNSSVVPYQSTHDTGGSISRTRGRWSTHEAFSGKVATGFP